MFRKRENKNTTEKEHDLNTKFNANAGTERILFKKKKPKFTSKNWNIKIRPPLLLITPATVRFTSSSVGYCRLFSNRAIHRRGRMAPSVKLPQYLTRDVLKNRARVEPQWRTGIYNFFLNFSVSKRPFLQNFAIFWFNFAMRDVFQSIHFKWVQHFSVSPAGLDSNQDSSQGKIIFQILPANSRWFLLVA